MAMERLHERTSPRLPFDPSVLFLSRKIHCRKDYHEKKTYGCIRVSAGLYLDNLLRN